MGQRIGVIVRPPGDPARVEELQRAIGALRAEGHAVSARMTFGRGDATRAARLAARRRFDVVVAAGGDGTINEVVNGLAREPYQPRLCVVPFGTANDFARGLGLPSDIGDALRIAVDGDVAGVDVARVNQRCFVNVSTGGFGADATRSAPAAVKRRFGPLAYLIAGAKRFVRFEPQQARFVADGRVVHDGDFIFFAVGNARLTGGGTVVTPRAEFGDGRLDAVVVCGASRLDFIAMLPDLRRGSHLESEGVLYLRAARFEVIANERIQVNADGEPLEDSSFRYRVMPRPIRLMVPRVESRESRVESRV